MSKASWSNANPVYRHHPGPRDSFVVVLADGKRIELTTVDHYEDTLARASQLAQQTKLAVKVLPMTASEYIAFAGIKSSDLAATPEEDLALRRLCVASLREVMMDADSRETRLEARALLLSMGEALC